MEEINDEAKIVYKKMINANLIFTDENKLASFLKDNIVKIDEWWSSSSVKLAKNDFNFNFSLPKSKKHLKDLSIIIKNQ